MDSKTGEIMSAIDMEKLKKKMFRLDAEEAAELIPMHLEERLRRHERKVREREQRSKTKNALNKGR